MKKYIELFNFIRQIRRYLILRKIGRYYQNKKTSNKVYLLLALSAIISAAAIYYVYFIHHNLLVKIIGIVACICLIVLCWIRINIYITNFKKKSYKIGRLILKDEEGRNIKEWHIEDKSSLLIGKTTPDNKVDIDLSDSQYSSFVNKQHVVLNYCGNDWFVEDIGSINGSGIKKYNQKTKIRLERRKSYKLDPGDILYIANTKIAVYG